MAIEYLAGNRIRGTNAERLALGDGTSLTDSGISKSNCLIYYNFEQTSGNLTNQATTANGFTDGLGSTGDGTSSGTVGKSNTGKVGNNAWSFDGSSGKTASSNSSDLVLIGDASWVGWVKIDSSDADFENIFGIRGGQSNDNVDNGLFQLFVMNSSPVDLQTFHEYGSGTNQSYTYNTNLSLDTWYHLGLIRDSTAKTVKLYINGTLYDTYSYTNNPDTSATTRAFELGHTSYPYYFDGMLDDVSLWDRVLTASEVSTLQETYDIIDGSIFYETDNNKEYILYNNTWTEL
jgi:hypothetical protein